MARAQIQMLPKDACVYLEHYHLHPEEESTTSTEHPAKKKGNYWLCESQKNLLVSMKCNRFICVIEKQVICLRGGEENYEPEEQYKNMDHKEHL